MANNSRFFFILTAVGACLGAGSVWVYPYSSFAFSGLYFIPYLIALTLIGVPILLLEFSSGKFFDKNIVDLFASVKKRLSYVGWLMMFNAFIVMSIYAVVLSWNIVYLFASFGMKWKENPKAYFFTNVLQSSYFDGFTSFSLAVFLALIIAWVIIFLYIRRGFESIKKGFLLSIPILVLLTFFFLAYSLKLSHSLNGIYFAINPRIKSLFTFDTWYSAFSLAALSIGASFGIMHCASRKSSGFYVGNSFIVIFFKLLISAAITLIVFSILGFLSFRNGADIGSLAFMDYGSGFTVLASALPLFNRQILLGLLFFIFLSLFFILGASSLAYSLTHVIVHKFKTRHFNAAVIVAGFGFLLGLLFVIKPGFYIMDIVNHFVYYNIIIALIFEVIAIGWFFDCEKLAQHINQNSSLKIGRLWKFFVKYIVPVILLALLFLRIKSDILSGYNNYPLTYLLIFGLGSVLVPSAISLLLPRRILDRK